MKLYTLGRFFLRRKNKIQPLYFR